MQSTSLLLNTIRQSWGWTGVDPAAIVAVNEFGNILVRSADDTFWRFCPEELSCRLLARTQREFEAIWRDDAFQQDWQMTRLVQIASAKLGAPGTGRCYCMKLSSVLGGAYAEDNFAIISHEELVAFTGDVARQIKDVPDGATIRFTLDDKRI
jgi:hypothetical protein